VSKCILTAQLGYTVPLVSCVVNDVLRQIKCA